MCIIDGLYIHKRGYTRRSLPERIEFVTNQVLKPLKESSTKFTIEMQIYLSLYKERFKHVLDEIISAVPYPILGFTFTPASQGIPFHSIPFHIHVTTDTIQQDSNLATLERLEYLSGFETTTTPSSNSTKARSNTCSKHSTMTPMSTTIP